MAQTKERPLPVFCFQVNIDAFQGGDAAFFKSASGLRYETEVVDVRAGGVNDTTYRLRGATKWSNIVLKQGFTKSGQLLKWRDEWIAGNCKRSSGSIQLLDTAGQVQKTWTFLDGWPCKWEISEFDASKTELAIETLEIAHHGLKFA
ncbi:MAG: phage tail protein [Kofleriaceae bacterium]